MAPAPAPSPSDVVGEIAARLSMKPIEAMSEPEKVFWAVASFTVAVLETGVARALEGDAGKLVPVFAEFASRYGTPGMVAVASSLRASGDPDSLEGLDEAFAACEPDIEAGLLALARKNAARFDGRIA